MYLGMREKALKTSLMIACRVIGKVFPLDVRTTSAVRPCERPMDKGDQYLAPPPLLLSRTCGALVHVRFDTASGRKTSKIGRYDLEKPRMTCGPSFVRTVLLPSRPSRDELAVDQPAAVLLVAEVMAPDSLRRGLDRAAHNAGASPMDSQRGGGAVSISAWPRPPGVLRVIGPAILGSRFARAPFLGRPWPAVPG